MFQYTIKQGQTSSPLLFRMVDSVDHVTPKTGLTPMVTLSKNGAGFGAPAGAVSEVGNGVYAVAGNATDSTVLGPLALNATSAGADPASALYFVDELVSSRASASSVAAILEDTSTTIPGLIEGIDFPPPSVIGRFDDDSADSPNVTWKIGEVAKTKTVTCLDANGDPSDLTDFNLTDAYLVIERAGPPRTDVQVIDIDDIDIGGTDNNELTFQADDAVLAQPGDFKWAFRQADESVIASGRITVSYAPMRDPTP